MTYSINNRLILEPYVKEALKSEIRSGIATPGQRDGLKGLKLLMDAHLADGGFFPKGSTAYIKEETLHNHSATVFKHLSCNTITGKFMVVELNFVEFVVTLDNIA
jgi:hypothetical protein